MKAGTFVLLAALLCAPARAQLSKADAPPPPLSADERKTIEGLLADNTLLDFWTRQSLQAVLAGTESLGRGGRIWFRHPERMNDATVLGWMKGSAFHQRLAILALDSLKRPPLTRALLDSGLLESKDEDIQSNARYHVGQAPADPVLLKHALDAIAKRGKPIREERSFDYLYDILAHNPGEASFRALLDRLPALKAEDDDVRAERAHVTVALEDMLDAVVKNKGSLPEGIRDRLIAYIATDAEQGRPRAWEQLLLFSPDTLKKIITRALADADGKGQEVFRVSPAVLARAIGQLGLRDTFRKYFLDDPKRFFAAWRDTYSYNDELLKSLFNEGEAVKLVRSALATRPKDDDAARRRAMLSLLAYPGKEATDYATELFKTLPKPNQRAFAESMIRFPFPRGITDIMVKDVLDWPYCSTPREIVARGDDAKEKERVTALLTPHADAVRKKAEACLADPKLSQYLTREWLQVLGSLGSLSPSSVEAFDAVLKRSRPDQWRSYLRAIAPALRSPQDDATADRWFGTAAFQNRESVLTGSRYLEELRESLSPGVQARFDAHIARLLAPSVSGKPGPCEMICKLRASSEKWLDPQFRRRGEANENANDFGFAVNNVVALFDARTKDLCKGATPLLPAPLAAMPPGIRLTAARLEEAEREETARKEKQLAGIRAGEALFTGMAAMARDAGWIDGKTHDTFVEKTKQNAADRRRAVAAEAESTPGLYSSSQVYGVAFGNLLATELTAQKSEAIQSEAGKQWAQRVAAVHTDALKQFDKKVSVNRNSVYGNYAIALSVLSSASPPASALDYMKGVAAKASATCAIPYDSRVSGDQEAESVFRSVMFYYALWKKLPAAESGPYRQKLVTCLGKYATSIPRGRSHAAREEGTHVGAANFAPYYYYASVPFASQAIADLGAAKDLPLADRNAVAAVGSELRDALADAFDTTANAFVMTNSNMYAGRPTYTNPLYGLALVPYCRAERSRE